MRMVGMVAVVNVICVMVCVMLVGMMLMRTVPIRMGVPEPGGQDAPASTTANRSRLRQFRERRFKDESPGRTWPEREAYPNLPIVPGPAKRVNNCRRGEAPSDDQRNLSPIISPLLTRCARSSDADSYRLCRHRRIVERVRPGKPSAWSLPCLVGRLPRFR